VLEHVERVNRARIPPRVVSATTLAKHLRHLGACLQAAKTERLIAENPVRLLSPSAKPKAQKKRPSYFTNHELARLWPELAGNPTLSFLCRFAAATGMRFGELAALRRTELDLGAGEVRVLRSQAELRGGRLVTKDPKSAAGVRTVAIPSAVVPELRSHLNWFSEPAPDGLVFVGPLGGRLVRRNFRRVWAEAVLTVGLDRLRIFSSRLRPHQAPLTTPVDRRSRHKPCHRRSSRGGVPRRRMNLLCLGSRHADDGR
jgi:integrase